jgi:hypothetical protein
MNDRFRAPPMQSGTTEPVARSGHSPSLSRLTTVRKLRTIFLRHVIGVSCTRNPGFFSHLHIRPSALVRSGCGGLRSRAHCGWGQPARRKSAVL